MKITLYMDVYPGFAAQYANAIANPTWVLCDGQKRLKFTVDIPDHLIQPEHTMELPPVTATEWKQE